MFMYSAQKFIDVNVTTICTVRQENLHTYLVIKILCNKISIILGRFLFF